MVAFSRNGKLERVAVAQKLLQCTGCGGAFYGVMEAPSSIMIENGVLLVEQDHGSRNVTDTVYRFRYAPAVKRFRLIGLDVSDNDRASGQTVSTSTNYLTGDRIVKTTPAKGRATTQRQKIKRTVINLEDADSEALESTD